MSQTVIEPAAVAAAERPKSIMTTGWVVKRALIGVGLLAVFITSSALLLHAAIDPSLDGEGFGETVLETIARIAGKL